jgi:transcription antitermination factor NusG
LTRTGWYILLVRQGFEETIKQSIDEMMQELAIEEILISEDLSGYVFVRSTEISHSSINCLLSLRGVLKFLGMKHVDGRKTPKKFSNFEIKKLKIQQPKCSKEIFKVGDCVIIKHGDLCDIEGSIVEIKKRIVKIKPSIFHKIVKVRIQDIEPI